MAAKYGVLNFVNTIRRTGDKFATPIVFLTALAVSHLVYLYLSEVPHETLQSSTFDSIGLAAGCGTVCLLRTWQAIGSITHNCYSQMHSGTSVRLFRWRGWHLLLLPVAVVLSVYYTSAALSTWYGLLGYFVTCGIATVVVHYWPTIFAKQLILPTHL